MTLGEWITDRVRRLIDRETSILHSPHLWRIGDSYIWNEIFIMVNAENVNSGMNAPQSSDSFSSRVVML